MFFITFCKNKHEKFPHIFFSFWRKEMNINAVFKQD